MTIFVFFKVQNIDCTGESFYSNSEVIAVSNLKVGQNLFLLDTKKIAKNIEEKLPYSENVKIIRQIPDKLIISTVKAKNYLSVEFNGQNVFLSSKLKVLDISNDSSDESIKVKGLSLDRFEIGKSVVFSEGINETNFLELLNLLEKNMLINNIKTIDFSNPTSIIINYDNRINIKLGLFEKIEYKLKTAVELIQNKIPYFEKGDLDLSMLVSDNRSYFNPNN